MMEGWKEQSYEWKSEGINARRNEGRKKRKTAVIEIPERRKNKSRN